MPTAVFQAQVALLGLPAGGYGVLDQASASALQSGPDLVYVLSSTTWTSGGSYNPGDIVSDEAGLNFWVAVAASTNFAPQVDGGGLFWQPIAQFTWELYSFYNGGTTYDSGSTYDSGGAYDTGGS